MKNVFALLLALLVSGVCIAKPVDSELTDVAYGEKFREEANLTDSQIKQLENFIPQIQQKNKEVWPPIDKVTEKLGPRSAARISQRGYDAIFHFCLDYLETVLSEDQLKTLEDLRIQRRLKDEGWESLMKYAEYYPSLEGLADVRKQAEEREEELKRQAKQEKKAMLLQHLQSLGPKGEKALNAITN